jgi:hypothetical protein
MAFEIIAIPPSKTGTPGHAAKASFALPNGQPSLTTYSGQVRASVIRIRRAKNATPPGLGVTTHLNMGGGRLPPDGSRP